MYPPKPTIARARTLRRTLSLPEVILWQAIRRQRLGARFRRQHPVGPYVLDFYCEAARLAVEVDGVSHEHPDRIRHDARRTAWLNLRGIAVCRIAARDVLGDLEGVLVSLKARTCPPPSGEGDHPKDGGGGRRHAKSPGERPASTERTPVSSPVSSPLHRYAVPSPIGGGITPYDQS